MADALTAFLAYLQAAEILSILGGVIVVLTVLEKGFDFEFVGRRIFRLLWSIVRFFANWAIHPAKPYIKEFKDFALRGQEIQQQLNDIAAKADERDQRRSEESAKLQHSVAHIEKEVTLNGGGSIKDAVSRLVRHDAGTWEILVELRDSMRITNLRLDLTDEADKRMSFRISPTLECTKISDTFLRFFGYTEKDVLGSDWEFCIAERCRQEVAARWTRAAERRTAYRNEHQFLIDSDGKEYKCLVRGFPTNNIDGEFDGFYGTVEVIDENV